MALKYISFIGCISLAICVIASDCLADWGGDRPDSHAPIGVMGEHTHEPGESMLSYRYMRMHMEGNLSGTNRLSEQEVLEDFQVAPTDMQMDMHMFGLMFAPSDRLTVMAMIPYAELSMNHVTRSGERFKTTSSGISDIKLTGLVDAINLETSRFILNVGVSLPSGEIDERGDIPVAGDAKLPYPMQLGSGTVDLLPGFTYLGQHDCWSWGAQGIGTIRLGRNDNDYSLGNRFDSTAWGSFVFSSAISGSFRATWSTWGNVDGADPELNPMMVPTADPNSRGGRRVDLAAGINVYFPDGGLKSLRFAAEFLTPAYQNLNGTQLETDWALMVGAQKSF